MPTKQCVKCKEVKHISLFSKCKQSKDGLKRECKYCNKIRRRGYTHLPLDIPLDMKICSGCKTEKSSNTFNKNRAERDGLQSKCRECNEKMRKEYLETPLDPVPAEKFCTYCKLEKRSLEFNKNSAGKDGLQSWCKSCDREKHYLKNYNLTTLEINAMLENQEYLCAICRRTQTSKRHGEKTPLSVDHCHKTGKIRGLLCSPCNTALGLFRDDPAILGAAALYLRSDNFIK